MKKIFISFIAVIMFLTPLNVIHMEQAQAAVVGKVVNSAAKKVAKEAIKDTAVQMSMEMVINYKYVPKDQRKPKQGYSFICMPKDKKSDGDCSKPLEIKSTLTSSDKKELGEKVEQTLDKKIAGGIGATKWGKFLDWFLPIFTLGMGFAVMDYMINGDVSDLFDDIAFDALKSVGFITNSVGSPPQIEIPTDPPPVTPPVEGEVPPIPEEPIELITKIRSDWVITQSNKYERDHWVIVHLQPKDKTQKYFYYAEDGEKESIESINYRLSGGSYTSNTMSFDKLKVWIYQFDYSIYDELVNDAPINFTTSLPKQYHIAEPLTRNEIVKVLNMFPNLPEIHKENDTPVEVEPIPDFDQLEVPRTNKENTKVPVVAPGGLPYEKTDTGEQLFPFKKPDGTTGWQTSTGVEVPEDNITVKDPNIIYNPDGSTSIQPPSSPGNPSPKPEPITPPTTKPPETGEPGGSCTERLKKPDFKPLTNAITTSFPFSIPWDLMRMFNAIFKNIGNEKPSYKYTFQFQGKEQVWVIELPKMFDSWLPFVKGLFLITFDIGLIYMIYRFTRGSD